MSKEEQNNSTISGCLEGQIDIAEGKSAEGERLLAKAAQEEHETTGIKDKWLFSEDDVNPPALAFADCLVAGGKFKKAKIIADNIIKQFEDPEHYQVWLLNSGWSNINYSHACRLMAQVYASEGNNDAAKQLFAKAKKAAKAAPPEFKKVLAAEAEFLANQKSKQ